MLQDNAIDLPKLWKWVQYYTNNWRLKTEHIQSVVAALGHSYWQGTISWADFMRARRLLAGQTTAKGSASSAQDFLLALSQIGRTIQGRYRITEVRGFVDQGILLQAGHGQQTHTLLCLTTNKDLTRNIIKQIPEINRLTQPFIIHVRSVLKEGERLYLVLSSITGVPLTAWLVTHYPTGLPTPIAQALLQQIYQMLVLLREESCITASIHPGQLFIDPESLSLQLIPFVASHDQTFGSNMRTRLYQAPSILPNELDESFLGYRLIAIAYELFTGCVPDNNHLQMREIIKNCEGMSRRTKQQIERCLLTQVNKSIPLQSAAVLLDVGKKHPILDATLMTLAILCAISALTWQGMRYLPLWLAKAPEPQTIVIQQDISDRHINLLKAAFFTQTEEANIAGARASWQALQQLLPADDVFLEKIGPMQLASSYIAAAEKLMQQDPQAAGVLVRAATRMQPQTVLPVHLQALAQLDAPTFAQEFTQDTQLSADALPDEIIAMTLTEEESLPPLPDLVIETVAALPKVDPCKQALTQKNKVATLCADALSDVHLGPRLLAMQLPQGNALAITHDVISVADYNQYCMMTGACTPQAQTSMSPALSELGLSDVTGTVHEYNTYCMVSSLCEPIHMPTEPMIALTPEEIERYTNWLSEQTGFTYRLATTHELQQMKSLSEQIDVQLADNTASLADSTRDASAFRLVREL
jgi:hypothetical protein